MPFNPAGASCRLVYGVGDCSESDFCFAPVAGECINGRCFCKPGFLGSNCGTRATCRYWDTVQNMYSTEGLVASPPPGGIPDGFLHCDSTHLTDFGAVSIPMSLDDLLGDLAGIQFNTFSLDDMASVLTSFNFSENAAVYLVLFFLTGLDWLFLCWLGCFRGHRRRTRREREVSAHSSVYPVTP